jgi:transcriptional regulator of nitric oxide reductase
VKVGDYKMNIKLSGFAILFEFCLFVCRLRNFSSMQQVFFCMTLVWLGVNDVLKITLQRQVGISFI